MNFPPAFPGRALTTWRAVIKAARCEQRREYYAVRGAEPLWIVVVLLGIGCFGLFVFNCNKGP